MPAYVNGTTALPCRARSHLMGLLKVV
eukprot:Gb_13784 [translate_table: standard]